MKTVIFAAALIATAATAQAADWKNPVPPMPIGKQVPVVQKDKGYVPLPRPAPHKAKPAVYTDQQRKHLTFFVKARMENLK